jgi:hypothetical protein
MEITQDELLEQSKISALEAGIFKTRLSRATALYESLYNKIQEELNRIDQPADFDFIDNFPAKIEF